MKILAEQLGDSPQSFGFLGSPQWWADRTASARETAYTVEEPFVFEVRARTMGTDLVLEGSVKGEIEVECSRCLVRYCDRVGDDFRLVLEPSGERVPADPESVEALARDGFWLGEDLELGSFRGNELNLETYLAEVIALALPVQPLCRPNCQGLCPHCGANRNERTCECTDRNAESPFAVLATLLDEKNEEKT